jgi:exoribonuclease R
VRLPWRTLPEGDPDLVDGLGRIRSEFSVPDRFPSEVDAEATAAVGRGPRTADRRDRTAVPFLALDPPGSRDLDQAFDLQRRPGGWSLRYAIADVAAWVDAGGAVDREAWGRGTTCYLPDGRAPLHPPVLSESAGSLLPGDARPAVLWTLAVDADGQVVDVDVERAMVRTVGALDYPSVQRALDDGTAPSQAVLLREIGGALRAAEAARGGVSLDLPEQVVERVDAGHRLAWRAPLPVEGWNAQLSLATGRAAAALMLGSGRGVLRTLPDPSDAVLDPLRRSSEALGVGWPADRTYAEWVRTLDPATSAGAVLLVHAARALRGSGYTVIGPDRHDGPEPVLTHAAIAAPYAHVTAPLRRLVDRHGTECALAAAQDREPPDWVLASLDDLPTAMSAAGQRQGAVDRAVLDLVEALVLEGHEGERFDGVVTVLTGAGATVQVLDPPIVATCPGVGLAVGDHVRVELRRVDAMARAVELVPVGDVAHPSGSAAPPSPPI